ncbi:uncharacterized protein LOC130793265 isoform X2 [Actinidia eriantha]|uniref:uncharacterized protein LOC130793265 isoform X2 n=1 Tax=Actinidia eriantha TaxID=165200 RepID=UPI00258D6372|nr:uncharacterized protein LOC130793265 isoform X2 [Actinidia eriantha]
MVQEVREVQGTEDQQVREDEVQLALHLVKEGEDHQLERWDRGRGSAGGSQGNGGVTGGSQSVGGAAACSQSLGSAAATSVMAGLMVLGSSVPSVVTGQD